MRGAILGVALVMGCATGEATETEMATQRLGERGSMGISSAFRVNGVVTLAFRGNPHGLSVGDTFFVLSDYGVASDAALFPHGKKVVTAVPHPDWLTYSETGPDGNNAGSFSIKAAK